MDSNNENNENTGTSDKLAAILNKYFKVEEGPAFGGGKLSADDDKLYCGLAHLFSIIIWPWKRKDSPAVEVHGKEALNMVITVILFVSIPLAIISTVLGTLLIKIHLWWLLLLAMYIINLGILGMFIYGLLKAREGKLLKYPFNLRLIK